MIDWYSVGSAIQVLVPLIAVSIAIIAVWNYQKIRSGKLLALSIAYALLAVYNVVPLINGNMLNYAVLLTLSVLAFTLLAYIYHGERKDRGIKATKLRWIVGSLSAISLIVALFYFSLNGRDGYLSDPAAYSQVMVQCILYSATILLEIYIILSLYSYFLIIKNKNTLIVMAGFICLLSTYLVSFLFITPPFVHLLASNFDYIAYVNYLGLSLTLAGYVMFLIALLRMRASR